MNTAENTNEVHDHDDPPIRESSSNGWLLFLLLPVVAILFWNIFFRSGSNRDPQATKHPAIGVSLPWLNLEPLTGEATTVTKKTINGKVVLLHFWGEWCGPCVAEFPHLVELEGKLRRQPDFQYIAVSSPSNNLVELDELKKRTETFMAKQPTTHPTYYDPDFKTLIGLNAIIGDIGYPTTILLDRTGAIRAVWEGVSSTAEMEDLIKSLLAEKQATP